MMSPLAPVSLNRSKSGPELKYDPALAKSVARKWLRAVFTAALKVRRIQAPQRNALKYPESPQHLNDV